MLQIETFDNRAGGNVTHKALPTRWRPRRSRVSMPGWTR